MSIAHLLPGSGISPSTLRRRIILQAGHSSNFLFHLPASIILLLTNICLILFVLSLLPSAFISAQPGWRQDDVVTWFDGRDARSADLTDREVVVATGGGLIRLERATAQPIDPWATGVGWDRALPLSGGRIVLWHPESRTIWLAARDALLYYRWDIERWARLEGVAGGEITSLGDAGDLVIVEQGRRLQAVNPPSYHLYTLPARFDTSGIRWQGRRRLPPSEFPFYHPTDIEYGFDPSSGGAINDLQLNVFRPVSERFDPDYRRRYICYPGLGIAVADERTGWIEVREPGPAGMDVQAFHFMDQGQVWIGGNNSGAREGPVIWNRRTGRWKSFAPRATPGLETGAVRAIAVYGGALYLAGNAGLVLTDLKGVNFRTLTRFDGLQGGSLRALSVAGGWLYIGGDQGVNRYALPKGPMFRSGSPKVDDLRTSSFATDGDTVWAGGLQGIWRSVSDGRWSFVSGEETIGDEAALSLAVTGEHLYIGGPRGIRILNRRTGDWRAIPGEVFLGGEAPLALLPADTNLWVGTELSLYRYDLKIGEWVRFGTREGFPVGRVNQLAIEGDSLWVATQKGLTRFLWNRPGRQEG
ncbi:MAG: hypothetical protein FJY67_09395 [Calditrichaeota bacterium]|nr:hypothetical protein [Calditrichota bacterium]